MHFEQQVSPPQARKKSVLGTLKHQIMRVFGTLQTIIASENEISVGSEFRNGKPARFTSEFKNTKSCSDKTLKVSEQNYLT